MRRFLERLTVFNRLILFDSRGTGLSDRLRDGHTLEQDVADALAVLDAAGSERAALFAYALGGAVGAQMAADHPERVGALVMYASVARTTWAPDYDWAMRLRGARGAAGDERRRAGASPTALARLGRAVGRRGSRDGGLVRAHAAPRGEPARRRARCSRDRARWTCARRCPTSRCPRSSCTAAATRRGTCATRATWPSRSPARATSSSTGSTRCRSSATSDAIVEEIEEFLTGERHGGELTRALLTVMFTDIVDATAHAARLGDGRWRDLLAHHDEHVRAELGRFGGREVKTVGDGFLAVFDGPPSRGLRCALAITRGAARAGHRGARGHAHRRVRADRRRRRRDGGAHRLARQRARRARARCWSRAPSTAPSSAAPSASRTAARTSSRACPGAGRCSRSAPETTRSAARRSRARR